MLSLNWRLCLIFVCGSNAFLFTGGCDCRCCPPSPQVIPSRKHCVGATQGVYYDSPQLEEFSPIPIGRTAIYFPGAGCQNLGKESESTPHVETTIVQLHDYQVNPKDSYRKAKATVTHTGDRLCVNKRLKQIIQENFDNSSLAVTRVKIAARAKKLFGFNFSLDVICTALYQAKDGTALQRMFSQNTDCALLMPHYASQAVLVAYVYALLSAKKFDAMFDVIKSSRFEECNFKELQDLWYQGRYKENELKRGKELGPVEKYRLRRKYPPPTSIWDGQETIYSFKEKSRKRLKDFYKINPYPNLEEKKIISRETELEIIQISNWFKNRRQRDKTSRSENQYGRGPINIQGLTYGKPLGDSLPYSQMTLMQPLSMSRRM